MSVARRSFWALKKLLLSKWPMFRDKKFLDSKFYQFNRLVTEGIFEWSESLKENILSSVYWGYIVTRIPSGMLVEKFDGKITLLAGLAATSLLTRLTTLSITLRGSTLLIINRVIMGLCQHRFPGCSLLGFL